MQVNLDELEEDLDDYGEYIRAGAEEAGGQPTPEEFRGDASGVGGPLREPEEGGPIEEDEGRGVPEGEQPEREDRTADEGMETEAGRADQPGGSMAGRVGAAIGPCSEEGPVPGPSG